MMINPNVTISNDFLELPIESKLLYYRLIENADDEGFIDTGTLVLKIDGANRNNLDDLIRIGYVREFDSRVLVVRHWWVHNNHNMRDMKKTIHTEEKSYIQEDSETRIYVDIPSESHWNPIGNQTNSTNITKPTNQPLTPVQSVGLPDGSIYYSLSDKDRESLQAECKSHNIDIVELIKAIDISIKNRKEQSNIRTPYKYILQIAEAKNWNISEINKGYTPIPSLPEVIKHYSDIDGSLWDMLDDKQKTLMVKQYDDDIEDVKEAINDIISNDPKGEYKGTEVSLFKKLADKWISERR